MSEDKPNLLLVEKLDDQVWFAEFLAMMDPLAQLLLLVAVMFDQGMLVMGELTQFKVFLFSNDEKRHAELLSSFLRHKSLYAFRSQIRGHLGIPRLRPS